MSAVNHAMSAYGRAATTMPPLQQIVLLYDATIARVREARTAIEHQRTPDLVTASGKAATILEALAAALDQERGGEIATNLERLYGDMAFRLQRLALEPDPAVCDLLCERLSELRGAWAELAARPTGTDPMPTGTPDPSGPIAEPSRAVTA